MNGYAKKLRDEMYQLKTDANFIELSEKCRSLNLFEVPGTASTEIHHSNFLACLLNPKGNLGLQDRFLRTLAAKLGEDDAAPNGSILTYSLSAKQESIFFAFLTPGRISPKKENGLKD